MSNKALMAKLELSSELRPEKRRNLPGVDCLPGHFARGVVATGQPDDIKRQVMTSRFSDRFVQQVDGKGQIVSRYDKPHGPRTHRRNAGHERKRTYRRPIVAKFFEGDVMLETSAHVGG